MEIQDAYKQKLAAQLKEWNAQINYLEAKAENAGADQKIRRAEIVHRLRTQHGEAVKKMQELEQAGGEAWEQAKATADKIWEDLKAGVADADSRLK